MADNDGYVVPIYAKRFHAMLTQQAKLNEYHELVFEGSLTKLYRELGASSSYYSPIRKLLIESDSITILKRGAGKSLSEVRVNELNENILSEGLTAASGAAILRADELRRLAALEAWRETTGGLNIQEALRNIESRLTELEARSTETGG